MSAMLLTVTEVAGALHIPKSTIYDLVRRGEIPSVRYGQGKRKRIRIEVGEVEEFVRRRRWHEKVVAPLRRGGSSDARLGGASRRLAIAHDVLQIEPRRRRY